MAIDTRKTTIAGHEYELTVFAQKQGQGVLIRLFKVFGPAAGELMSKGSQGVGAAFRAFADIDERDLMYLIDVFAEKTKLYMPTISAAGEGGVWVPLKTQYDAHFGQRYGDSLTWLIWAIKENFSSFLSGQGLESLKALFPEVFKSKPQKDSIGSSGESQPIGESKTT